MPGAPDYSRCFLRKGARGQPRGDWEAVAAHRAAIDEQRPELDHLYETLAGATLALAT